MLKKIANEFGFLTIKLSIAFSLLPILLYWFDFRSSNDQMNTVERLFLIEICMLTVFCTVLVLYILRFLLSILLKKMGAGAKEQKAP
jgi:predicted membrane protein